MKEITISIESNVECFIPDLADVLRIFVGETVSVPSDEAELIFKHTQHAIPGAGLWQEHCTITYQGCTKMQALRAEIVQGKLEFKRHQKRAIKRCAYALLKRFFARKPSWGSLTGIRPTRLLYEEWNRLGDMDAARDAIVELYDVDADKAELLKEIVWTQRGMMDEDTGVVDLYIGIPFCTTRCAYCSFISEEVGKGRKLPAYFEALHQEMDAVKQLIDQRNLRVRAVYVGGGTPTAVAQRDLEAVLRRLSTEYPNAQEFTVEAGRPDTMREDMLCMIRAYPVTRISVNPQTMSDETLCRIGRAHSAAQTEQAMETARKLGFDNINMDIIAALPGEREADFARTLEHIERMAPESLTVHTLAVKRASKLRFAQYEQAEPEEVARMLARAHNMAHRMGMSAYYLYRQKYMAGNLENVGYALPGSACRYNIDHMEETTSILALGAGGISKRLFHRELRIERAPNVSNIDHYIARVGEMIERKRRLFAEKGGS